MEKKFRLLLLLALLMTAATGAWAQSTVNGLFTVNADGDQVQFASGNLRYTSGAWSFFDHQYDYYAEYSADSWDKFGWSTSGTTYGMSTSTNESLYKGDFVDWGNAVGTGWRTLSNDEWAYVVNTRSGSTIGTTANARFAKAVVCDVKGLIIFPDDYAHPNGVTAPTGINETGATGMDGNSYDATAWALMESAGCVFLPAAGGRYNNSNPTLVVNVGNEGCYWSSTSDNSIANFLSFKRNTFYPSNTDSPRMGYSVRLVKSVTTFTVSLKSDVKDADKWTVKVGEGQAQALPIGGLKGDGSETVTLQYNGRLKVKGVKATSDAAPAKTPATVTTAPTGAAIVGVGKTTALVSGGAADGGTLMYAVTTTNTKPTSTDGFSATVPTAQTITASGKVYVWYFVKADDTHTDSEIAATAIEVPVADIVWDVTNVSDLYITGTGWTYEMEGITLSGNAEDVKAQWFDFGNPEMDGIGFDLFETGGFTFTAPTGKAFTKIVMTLIGSSSWDNANLGTGWAFNWDYGTGIATVTWTGSAASMVDLLKDADEFTGSYAKSIAFYLSE